MANSTLDDRFWSKVDVRGPDDCWPWTGALNNGYGRFFTGGSPRYDYAHRVAYALAYGVWPRVARHACDNPPCCNPVHVLDGDHADNRRDAVDRGRHQHGEGHWKAKIGAVDVPVIRARRAAGETLKAIGDDYGVSPQHVWMIAHRRTWKHLP